jgi:hypothetical protein
VSSSYGAATTPATMPPGRSGARPHGEPRVQLERLSLGAVPLLALIAAGGLMMVAAGNNAAREAAVQAQPLFWGGLVVIYGPIAFRLLSGSASRAERIALVLLLGIALFGVKILHSPANFDLHDELGTWRQTSDLLHTGGYFSPNPLVEGYAGYPTLAAVTAALVQLGHLSIFHAALIVIGVARTALMLILFLFLERITGSARAAGIGVAIYACNPSFLYFDSQFGYESLALPIAATLLLVSVLWSEPEPGENPRMRPELLAGLVVLACTLTISHHMTSYAMFAFFVSWAIVARLTDPTRTALKRLSVFQPINAAHRRRDELFAGPALPAAILAVTVGTWFLLVAQNVTVAELGGTLSGVVESTVGLVLGSNGPKTLFQSSGQTNPFAARVLAIASVIPLLAMIPFGLLRTWRRPAPSIWRTLAIVGALYPITLGLRLTLSGTETSQRASEFVYVGLAFLAAILVGGIRRRASRPMRVLGGGLVAGVATIIFLGGFVVGESPVTRQPGPFLVSAESRSVSAQGLAAAQFATRHLPPYTNILSDRPNATFLASYAHLNPLLGYIDERPVTSVYFSKDFTPGDRRVIEDGHIRYLVVDGRMSQSLPVTGIYFERFEPNAFNHRKPISHAALTKFNLSDNLDRIYTNGPIVIYNTSRVRAKK